MEDQMGTDKNHFSQRRFSKKDTKKKKKGQKLQGPYERLPPVQAARLENKPTHCGERPKRRADRGGDRAGEEQRTGEAQARGEAERGRGT